MTVPVDDSFPAFLRDNQHRFRHLVKPVADDAPPDSDDASILLLRLSNEVRRCSDLISRNDTPEIERREALRLLHQLKTLFDARA